METKTALLVRFDGNDLSTEVPTIMSTVPYVDVILSCEAMEQLRNTESINQQLNLLVNLGDMQVIHRHFNVTHDTYRDIVLFTVQPTDNTIAPPILVDINDPSSTNAVALSNIDNLPLFAVELGSFFRLKTRLNDLK